MRLLSKATVALVAAGVALSGVPAAHAVAAGPPKDEQWYVRCARVSTTTGPNLDDGYGVMKGSFNLKKDPAQGACNVTRMRAGQVLYFHCWRKNSHGNLWVYGRIKGTRTHGWMSLANFRSVYKTDHPRCDWNKDKDHT
ncbi:hypothetical protein WBK31_37895 [Nonomuraea sp. N2-4H]|uniref:hypothetical protein n=1 Tax=Nonomuraea sp. N2-4H TaxID=3128898 RepID=UPI00324B56FB